MCLSNKVSKTRFIRRILVASNAIKTIDNDRSFKKLGEGPGFEGHF